MMTYETFVMPTKSKRADCLLDTSVAIAFVQPGHAGHHRTVSRLAGTSMGLAGHAVFETFSVLTRLPVPHRLSGKAARRLIEVNFPHSSYLSAERSAALLADFAAHGLSGGSVYDGLVGAVARESGLLLFSRDRRAVTTYQALGVEVELLD